MQVLEFSPIKESLNTCVSLLSRNGVWALFCPRALMHSWGTAGEAEVPSSFQNALSLPAALQGHLLPCSWVRLPSEPGDSC